MLSLPPPQLFFYDGWALRFLFHKWDLLQLGRGAIGEIQERPELRNNEQRAGSAIDASHAGLVMKPFNAGGARSSLLLLLFRFCFLWSLRLLQFFDHARRNLLRRLIDQLFYLFGLGLNVQRLEHALQRVVYFFADGFLGDCLGCLCHVQELSGINGFQEKKVKVVS